MFINSSAARKQWILHTLVKHLLTDNDDIFPNNHINDSMIVQARNDQPVKQSYHRTPHTAIVELQHHMKHAIDANMIAVRRHQML